MKAELVLKTIIGKDELTFTKSLSFDGVDLMVKIINGYTENTLEIEVWDNNTDNMVQMMENVDSCRITTSGTTRAVVMERTTCDEKGLEEMNRYTDGKFKQLFIADFVSKGWKHYK